MTLYSLTQASKLFSIPYQQIIRYVHKNVIVPVRVKGKAFYREQDLRRLTVQRQQNVDRNNMLKGFSNKGLVGVSEASRLCGVSRPTIYSYLKARNGFQLKGMKTSYGTLIPIQQILELKEILKRRNSMSI